MDNFIVNLFFDVQELLEAIVDQTDKMSTNEGHVLNSAAIQNFSISAFSLYSHLDNGMTNFFLLGGST